MGIVAGESAVAGMFTGASDGAFMVKMGDTFILSVEYAVAVMENVMVVDAGKETAYVRVAFTLAGGIRGQKYDCLIFKNVWSVNKQERNNEMPYAKERIERITKEFTDRFKDHIATFTDLSPNCSVLEWVNKDGSTVDHFVAVLHSIKLPIKQCALMIYGDLDEATFVWYHSMSWGSFENVSLDYFLEKCRASEVGNRFVIWDKKEAEETIRNLEEGEDKEENAFFIKTFKDDDASCLDSAEEWCAWLNDITGTDVDSELLEHLYDCGEVVHDRAIAYLTGIKMALKQRGITDSATPNDLKNEWKVKHGRDCIKEDS